MDLNEMRARYEREEGYSRLNATARVCQDVILSKLAASSMRDRVTVKGGVLMCALSGSSRRATQDIDLDFVRYPMTDASIRSFVSALSNLGDGITVRIAGEIEELSHQDYRGRRVNLKISDGRSTLDTKLDLGVHASATMEQDELWFDVAHRQEGVCLLANSKEQVFAEKLKSLLLHGIRSTRFRDLYDMYYIGHRRDLDRERLARYIDEAIVEDRDMWDESIEDVVRRVERTLSNRRFLARMKSSHRDWIGRSAEEVARWLPGFLATLNR